jgi:hypothetical protein
MTERQRRLLALIEGATGKAPYTGTVAEEGEDVGIDADALEADKTVAVARRQRLPRRPKQAGPGTIPKFRREPAGHLPPAGRLLGQAPSRITRHLPRIQAGPDQRREPARRRERATIAVLLLRQQRSSALHDPVADTV